MFISALKGLPAIVRSLSRRQKFLILMGVDVGVIPVAVLLSVWLIGGAVSYNVIVLLCLTGAGASLVFGLPRIKLNSFEQKGIMRTAAYAILVGVIGFFGSIILSNNPIGLRHFMILTMILIIVSVSARLMMRSLLLFAYRLNHNRQAVLIYGAGQTGVQLAVALGTDDAFEPVAFVDDNPTLQQVLVAGLPVYSPARVTKIIKKHNVKRVVMAMPSISRPKRVRIARYLKSIGCDVVAVPSFASLVGDGDIIDRVEPVNLSDYLGRSDLDSELRGSAEIYQDRTVMITGAGGSIGSELTRQVLQCRPRKLVLVDVSEHALYLIDRELTELGVDSVKCEVIPVLGSVTDAALIKQVFATHDVDTVLHAAAYKHVPLVERNRLSGLHNNVIGTSIVARAAQKAGVGTFILVSSDKAVQPSSIMGASKRFAELFVQDIAVRSKTTRYGIVRFGNVLGSSGSVVPLFDEQIARGGPVTLTHTEVTRYFMTISEAVRLVLIVGGQSHLQNEQGQVYVLDMGDPMPIHALAKRMIKTAGYSVCDRANPNGDIEIVVTGLRAGEKLHEKLTFDNAKLTRTAHPKIMRVDEMRLSELEMAAAMRDLNEALNAGDEVAAVRTLQHWLGLPNARAEQIDASGVAKADVRQKPA